MSRKEIFFLILLLLGALVVRAFFLSKVEVVWPDEAYYMGLGFSMKEGRDYGGFPVRPFEISEMTQGMRHGQPLLPLLYALAGRVGSDPILACQWTSVIFSLLTLILFYLSARSLMGFKETLLSSSLFAFAPFAIQYSLQTMTHALYIFFLVALFLCLLKAQVSEKNRWAFWGALAAWGAYLVRVEAVLFTAMLAPAGIIFPWLDSKHHARKVQFRMSVIFLLTFVILSIPLWIWIRQTTGVWQLDWADRSPLSDELNDAFFFSGPVFSIGTLLQWAVYYLKNFAAVDVMLFRTLPFFIWILIAFGGLNLFSQSGPVRRRIALSLPFVAFPILFYPLFKMESRFFYPSLAFLLIFLGPGVALLFGKTNPRRRMRLVWLGMIILSLFPGYRSLLLDFKEEPLEHKQMGKWIQANFSKPQTIFLSDIRSCFYAGPRCRRYFSLFKADERMAQGAGFEDFLKENEVDLVVVDTHNLERYHPSLRFLAESPPEFLEKIREETRGTNRIILYEYAL